MNILFLIPARGGSKGIPGKNIKPLAGRPLIYYTIDAARGVAADPDICVSTDDPEIRQKVEAYGLKVPFLRPAHLAKDTSGTYDVCLHALEFYEQQGRFYDLLVLLQPTSPFRTAEHIKAALALYKPGIEMVVSVKETASNPYYVLYEENEQGYLAMSKPGNYARRQDCPKVWEYNGAVYVINVSALKQKPWTKFTNIKKYEMDELVSVDIDTPIDWLWTEFIINQGFISK
ncbi:MAG TPA: acylneuraminate cytidylyltransferase family protein [Chitinophagaceae bacterium]|nr:acylneuraminate cytidylyltransferase family protein [Chitinophagaceae bacterium]